ncbi:uncharacterized protein LOC110820342 [Carica papaya]|uniref:uncharacterized protein LOC110820342 n=1 Tax=Carica papaya TaxID=3649 RepID=UPI000B8CC809|nr:uncharacterized protein LOC110820342 [Carica papaya]
MGKVNQVKNPYYTNTNRRHKGRNTMPRNQQHKNFVLSYCFSFIGIGTKKNGWANEHPSRSYSGYPYSRFNLEYTLNAKIMH